MKRNTSDFCWDSQSPPLNQTRITSNFWLSRMRAAKEGALPAMWLRMKETGRWDVLKLEWKEGMPDKPHHFWDSDVAKWTEAACYALTPPLGSTASSDSSNTQISDIDEFLSSKISEAVDLISGAQWSDGYINSYFTVVEPGKRWTNIAWNHEHYCAGHLLEAALAHNVYAASASVNCDKDSTALLTPLLRYVAHIDERFGMDVSKGQKRGYPGHQELELALLRLYEHLDCQPMPDHGFSIGPFLNKEEARKRVLSLASFFIHERGLLRDGVHYYDYEADLRDNSPPAKPGPSYPTAPRWMYNQANAPISHIQNVEGHSVRAGYWLTAVAQLARITKDGDLLRDAQRLWQSMVDRKMHITGGLGAVGDWEGFGPDYYYPNESSYLETCASVALIFFAHQMLLIDPTNVRYGDTLERALYNGALVGMSLDGKTFFYDNPLATIGKWRERTNWFEVSCCPPNLVRLISSLGRYVYTQSTTNDQDTIHVHLFVDSEATFTMRNGKNVRVIQESTLPWGTGNVVVRVVGPGARQPSVTMRIPDWADPEDTTIDITGYTSCRSQPRIFSFTPGSTSQERRISLQITIKARVIYPHPLDTENHASIAIARGPFIYCAETIDNPGIDDLRKIRIPDDLQFEELIVDISGEDMIGLKGRVGKLLLPEEEGDDSRDDAVTEGWVILDKDEPFSAPTLKKDYQVDVTLVPFFAWANRGPSDVRVWLPTGK